MKAPLFKGSATALITPMKNGEIDLPALDRLLERQLSGGIQALVPCGTTGEPATLSPEEWRTVIARTVDVVGKRVPVIAGTGGNNTRDVIEKANLARQLGADAQLCVTPYYNKTTQEGLLAHYRAIARETALPVILYSVPARTGMAISVDTLKELSRLDQIVALKEAGGDIARAADIRVACGDDLPLYCGADEMTVPMLSIGASGVISVLSNAMPEAVRAMTDAWFSGNVSEAGRAQLLLLPLIRLLFRQVSPIPIKAALHLMGVCENELRLPLVPLSGDSLEPLRRELERLEVLPQ